VNDTHTHTHTHTHSDISKTGARSHTCYCDDIFSAYALCTYTLGIFYSLSVEKAFGIFVALAMNVKKNIRTTCIPRRRS